MISSTVVRPPDPELRPTLRLALVFAAIKLLLQFALTLWSEHAGYGYFRDEFYYIVCGRHLAWGYVDHGPIVALQARIGEILFGDSVFAIRILSSVAGAVAVFLTGVVAWAMGGKRDAQALAMLAVLASPMYLGVAGFLSMNSFEPMFWVTCVLALLLMERGYSQCLCWVLFGASAGIGLLNKPSLLFFLMALAIGLVLTPQRRLLFTRWAAVGVALLILIALPNVLWQMHHGWATLEFLRSARAQHPDVVMNPAVFLLTQMSGMNPINAALWITGVVVLLRARMVTGARWLGIAFTIFFSAMWAMHAKDYYVLPAYPPVLAAGAIAWKRRAGAQGGKRLPVLEVALVAACVFIVPMMSPVLAPDAWMRYAAGMGEHRLPQFFADRFGFQEQVNLVVSAYRSLSPEEQRNVCIYGDNYGEVGAVDFLGPREEPRLPPAISGHNNYWWWGPRGCSGELVIAISGDTPEELGQKYRSVAVVGHVQNKWALPSENRNIYLLRGRLMPVADDWAKLRHYD